MPITFNSAGGFLNGTISSSNNNIFITTSGSVGSIHIGNQQLTGSQIIEKDSAGKVRNKKTFNADGSITQEKFDQNELVTETKIKDPASGKEFIRSGSATSNQIEFKQDTFAAEITLSGSGINKLTFLGSNDGETHPGFFQRQDTPKGTVYSQNTASVQVVSTGITRAGDYHISPGTISPINTSTFNSVFKVTQTGDVSMSGDLGVTGNISANSLNVTHFTSSFVTSSTITTEGNTIFGDTITDTHTFNGHITASGNISASGDLFVNEITTTDDVNVGTTTILGINDTVVNRDLYVGRNINVSSNINHTDDADTNIAFTTDAITFKAGNEQLLKLTEGIQDVVTIGDGGDVDFLVKTSGDDTALKIIGSSDNVGIGTGTPSKKLEVQGDISASGQFLGKLIDVKNSSFFHNNSNNRVFVPLAGTLTEITSGQPYTMIMAPYSGRLVKVLLYGQVTNPGTTIVGFHTGSFDLTTAVLDTTAKQEITLDMVDDTTTLFRFSSSIATFNAGDRLGISVDRSSTNGNYMSATSVWEYNTSDEGDF